MRGVHFNEKLVLEFYVNQVKSAKKPWMDAKRLRSKNWRKEVPYMAEARMAITEKRWN